MTRIVISLITVLIAGCASVTPLATSSSTIKHVLEKNYALGIEQSTYVGQPIIRVKDYWMASTTKISAYPSNGFIIKGPLFGEIASGERGVPIPILGTTQRDGATFNLMKPLGAGLLFLIDEQGKFEGSAQKGFERMIMTYRLEPATTTFSISGDDIVDSTRGFINYELVYSGATKEEIKILYREYTQQDMARPAYSQELTYAKDSSLIRYKDLQVRIISAGNEAIRYVVTHDGQP